MAGSKAQPRTPQSLLTTAAQFRLLAQGFAYPEPGQKRAFLGMLSQLPPERGAGVPLRLAWLGAGDVLLRDEYSRLFIGHAPCSLHETAYGDGRRIARRAPEFTRSRSYVPE